MTGQECEKLILKLWPSAYHAAPDLGFSYRQLRRMVKGTMPVHPTLARLLRVMVAHKVKPDDLRD